MDKITLVSKGASLPISDEKLLIEFDRDMNSLSTALWAGGYRSIRSALNQKLTGVLWQSHFRISREGRLSHT